MEDGSGELNLFREMGCNPIPRKGTTLIPKNEALECSRNLLNRGVRILGYEGIVYSKNKNKASLENIADYSSGQPSLQVVESFFEQIGGDITHLIITIDL